MLLKQNIKNLSILKCALEKSWGRNTAYISYQAKWTCKNKALGQCCVTAFLVQEYFGGEIYKADIVGEENSHFWNVLPNGEKVDFTESQFQGRDVAFTDIRKVDRERLLEEEELIGRYNILKKRVEKYLSDKSKSFKL